MEDIIVHRTDLPVRVMRSGRIGQRLRRLLTHIQAKIQPQGQG